MRERERERERCCVWVFLGVEEGGEGDNEKREKRPNILK